MIDNEALQSIEKLHELKASGALSEEEFTAAKQRLFESKPSTTTTRNRGVPKDTGLSQLRGKLGNLRPKHWAIIAGVAVVLMWIFGSSGGGIDPATWNCENIKDDVIASSQGEDLEILEIGAVMGGHAIPNVMVNCSASATWNQGVGPIDYSASVSEGGNIIISYRQG